jgi:hypothetical protein
MGTEHHTHVAFADESSWNQGRFRSIALVSASVDDARVLHKELEGLRKQHGASEFKWKEAKRRHGIALSDFFFKHYGRMRADVLIWDMEDSRHKGVFKRDDKANFERMYYHLLHFVLKRCWPDEARWIICADSKKDVDWRTMKECLGWKSWAKEYSLFTYCGEMPAFQNFYNVIEFRPVCSKKYLLVQLADLFAGLAAYSYSAFDKYQKWKSSQNHAPMLFKIIECKEANVCLSKRDQERLPVLHHVRLESKRRSLGVSLDSSKGLCSRKPTKPLNFWPYTPQSQNDKAPVKHTL